MQDLDFSRHVSDLGIGRQWRTAYSQPHASEEADHGLLCPACKQDRCNRPCRGPSVRAVGRPFLGRGRPRGRDHGDHGRCRHRRRVCCRGLLVHPPRQSSGRRLRELPVPLPARHDRAAPAAGVGEHRGSQHGRAPLARPAGSPRLAVMPDPRPDRSGHEHPVRHIQQGTADRTDRSGFSVRIPGFSVGIGAGLLRSRLQTWTGSSPGPGVRDHEGAAGRDLIRPGGRPAAVDRLRS